MRPQNIRYQPNPMLADTVGFFDSCIPLTDESRPPANDSLEIFYYFGIYDYKAHSASAHELVPIRSVFATHGLTASPAGPKPVEKQPTDWITILLLACLLVFAWIQSNYPKRFRQIFHAAAQPYYVNQLEREGDLLGERISIGLGFIYYATVSLFAYELFLEFSDIPFNLNNYSFTGIVFVGFVLFEFLKSWVGKILGSIFNTGEPTRSYQLNTLIFNHVQATLIFPFVILALFWESHFFLIISIIISSVIIVYRLYRGILTGLANKRYNLFYLFLYLCTLEILPFLLLFKWITKY